MDQVELQELTGRCIAAESGPTEALDDIELDVSIQWGRAYVQRKTLAEIEPDTIVPLDESAEDGVGIWVGDRLIARGELVVIDGKWGVRVAKITAGQSAVG